nr:hypothetical protein [Victivallales bacterium]
MRKKRVDFWNSAASWPSRFHAVSQIKFSVFDIFSSVEFRFRHAKFIPEIKVIGNTINPQVKRMDAKEIKSIVSKMLDNGAGLSEIQRKLSDEHQVRMTFLDLKLIVSEIKDAAQTLDRNSGKSEQKEAVVSQVQEGNDESADGTVETEIMDEGATVVELDKLLKPGTALSGNVKFASGAKADWAIDNYGRFTLSNATGKPTSEDIALFQAEL